MQAAKSQLKTSLAHLPKNKQVELEVIREIILRYVEAEMIILFGSYARGDWVEESYREIKKTTNKLKLIKMVIFKQPIFDGQEREVSLSNKVVF